MGPGMLVGPLKGVGRRGTSLARERTRAITVWWCARRAARRREPRLPVAPRRRTRCGLEESSILLKSRAGVRDVSSHRKSGDETNYMGSLESAAGDESIAA